MSDALFAPTPSERLAMLERFVTDEYGHRRAMRNAHHEKHAYWQKRVDLADEALEQVKELEKIVAVLGIDAGVAALVVQTLEAEAEAKARE